MIKQVLNLSLLIFSFLFSNAQNISVNIGQTTSPFDSTFVISNGTTSTYNSSNHPGAGPYTGAEILLCQGATLSYDYGIGTSNNVTFYMDENSTLIFPSTSQGTIAKFYVKNNATFQIPSTITIYAEMKREPGAIVAGMPFQYMNDSTFANINFTFNGWANPCSPTGTNQIVASKEEILFQNPISNQLIITSNSYRQAVKVSIFNNVGQCICRNIIDRNTKAIPINLPDGFLFYTISNENGVLEQGKLLNY
ncbi:MAG: T9SS type A sorting domain-containing protein [Chitinophagaceae bacterium]|nr:T9SS type A sorting domain-containing protein [Chitinophagaceae bacterium]